MKVAGNANGTTTGVAVSADGKVLTIKRWENEVTKIYDDTPTNAATYACTEIAGGDAGAFSLRVSNYTNQDITLGFYSDVVVNTYGLRDSEGSITQFTVPAGKTNVMITPDDWPQLQWLAKLRVYFILANPSESGKVIIYAVAKR